MMDLVKILMDISFRVTTTRMDGIFTLRLVIPAIVNSKISSFHTEWRYFESYSVTWFDVDKISSSQGLSNLKIQD